MGGGPARRGGEGKRGGAEARSSLVSFDIMSDITDCCIAMDFCKVSMSSACWWKDEQRAST